MSSRRPPISPFVLPNLGGRSPKPFLKCGISVGVIVLKIGVIEHRVGVIVNRVGVMIEKRVGVIVQKLCVVVHRLLTNREAKRTCP